MTGTKILGFGKNTNFISVEYTKKNDRIVNETELFFGNQHQDPRNICTSEDGIFCSTYTIGYWGLGAYFTKEAVYSHPHAYESSGSKSMILAYVILGQSKMFGTTRNLGIKLPPVKTDFVNPLGCLLPKFDSVVGMVTTEIPLYVIYNHQLKCIPSILNTL